MVDRNVRMVGRLSSAFNRQADSTNAAVLASVSGEMDADAGVMAAIDVAHDITQATGTSLDLIATMVGLIRYAGEADDIFRGRIRTEYFARQAMGTLKNVRRVVRLVTGYADVDFDIIERRTPIPEGGWGVHAWGTDEWGGEFPGTATFRLVFRGHDHEAFSLAALKALVSRTKAVGVTFLDASTIFLSSPGMTVGPVSALGEEDYVQIGNTANGWGLSAWGTGLWGGLYVSVSSDTDSHVTLIT